jgi:hypothetical protein
MSGDQRELIEQSMIEIERCLLTKLDTSQRHYTHFSRSFSWRHLPHTFEGMSLTEPLGTHMVRVKPTPSSTSGLA